MTFSCITSSEMKKGRPAARAEGISCGRRSMARKGRLAAEDACRLPFTMRTAGRLPKGLVLEKKQIPRFARDDRQSSVKQQ
jgi:hypothetical protein